MAQRDAAEMVRLLLRTEPFGVLATSGPEGAYASLMSFVAVDEGGRIVFATERDGTKFRNLQRCGYAAFLVDNRSGAGQSGEVLTATAVGRTREAKEDEVEELRAALRERHPDLARFLGREDCAIMVLVAERYRVFGHFRAGDEVDTTLTAGEVASC